jgi:hypothetical protein
MTQLFDAINNEHSSYVQAATANNCAIEELCVMQQCFEELPDIISDAHAQKVLDHFYDTFNNKILLDRKTVKQLMVSLALLENSNV